MALTDTALSAALQTEIAGAADIEDPAQLAKMCDAIAKAIVETLKSDAVIVMANGGADTNGDSLVTNEGEIT